ncbi:MAG: DNA primase [Bacteroidia bacterium]|nr:DNA primase [Bacteroidia bacterium]
MARIPQHIVDQIYNALDIVDIISDYMPLKKRGANYWARSPFSNEKTPSFAVNPVKGIYKDFSSGKGGNAINFLMEIEGYEYVDALKHIARKYNIEIEEEEETEETKVEKDKRQSLYVVNEFAARYFQEQLLETPKGRQIGLSYFKERGILEATITEFQLGYCQEEWEAFAKAAVAKFYKEEYLIELGLVSRSEKTGNLVDRFRGRVIFPIANPVGKVVGFGGRILGKAQDIAKYINSPESEIYHKGQILYGLFQAKKAIRDLDVCILTEGYMDTVILHQNGIKNVVASSGTALTPEQIRLIRRFTKNVLMIYDGDAAGVKAALRGIDLLLKEGMNARVLVLPDNHDPDSYVNTFGAQAFKDFSEKEALSFLDFKIRVMSEGKPQNDPRFQSELIKSLAETVGHIPDRVERQMYIKHVAQQVDITEALMTHAVEEARREIGKLESREKRREEIPSQKEETSAPVKDLKGFEQLPLASQEKELLRVIVNYHDKNFSTYEGARETPDGTPIEIEEFPLLAYLMAELEGLTFENQTYEDLKNQMFSEYTTLGSVNIQRYLNHDDDALRKTVSDLMISPYEISPGWKKHGAFVIDLDDDIRRTVESSVYHYKSRKVEHLLTECKDQLKAAEAEGNAAESDRLLEFYMYLLDMRKTIHKKLGTEGAIRSGDGRL